MSVMHTAIPSGDLDALSVGALVSVASDQPPLDIGTERLLIDRARDGDPGALEELVMRSLRIAVDEAIKARGLGQSQRELVRTGVRTLMDTARRYDPDVHGVFSQHARRHVRLAMRERIGVS